MLLFYYGSCICNILQLAEQYGLLKTDETTEHTHSISGFNRTASVINNNNLALPGTTTISMKEGPVNNFPITINIPNQGAINLRIDPIKTDNHFGND